MNRLVSFSAALTVLVGSLLLAERPAHACEGIGCQDPGADVEFGPGVLMATALLNNPGSGIATATNAIVTDWVYSLLTPCQFDDPRQGACTPTDAGCPVATGRVIQLLYVIGHRVVQPDRRPIDGLPPEPTDSVGAPYGPADNQGAVCVDVTDLNPPPSPGEVYRYFQTLPLPELTMQQQPPGNGLVGLPVIFYTDSPTTQTFTVDIRGFTVVIQAGAVSYTWHTGDGTDLTSDDPGAPYPNQTITHNYSSGSYTASLTTTWGATYTVNGGASADVPGTTTTDGPPVTFAVLQARPVLTNPFD